MNNLHRIENATDTTIWRGRDVNYPGVPQPDEPPAQPTRIITGTRGLDYESYVLGYSARQRTHAFMVGIGMAGGIGAAFYLAGPLLVIVVAIAIGLVIAGGVSLVIAAGAHASYGELARTRTENYAEPKPEPAPGPRLFVSSQDAAGTVLVGDQRIGHDVLRKLLGVAAEHDGRVLRDKSIKVLPRELYRNWQQTVGELARLGIIDDEQRVTRAGWQFYTSGRFPLPHQDDPPRARTSTHARRTHGAHGAEFDAGEG